MSSFASLTLSLDPSDTAALNSLWNFGCNTCHAPLLLRSDLRQQLRLARQELGFQFVRCHGWLNDDMGEGGPVLRADGSYDFRRIERAIDGLLHLGLRPFFELSGMPGTLARTETTITAYDMRTAPPKDWTTWRDLVRALVQRLRDRYGADEVAQWYFEVWNEPDLPFWAGTREEYFKLYDLSARAVKAVDPSFRIGGPATARAAWIGEFLDHLATPLADFKDSTNRCDFISTHAYPSDIAFLDAARGAVTLQESAVMRDLYTEVRRKVDAAKGAAFPVFCGEWNSSAGPLVANHDECNNAAFIVKTMHELSPLCQGSLFWNLSDIYEECTFHHEPFHGGYGLLTVNDLPKAGYHAFKLLNQQRGRSIAARWSREVAGVGCIASADENIVRALVYNYREPASEGQDVRVQLATPAPTGHAALTRILPGQGSAYETWLQRGRPMFVNRELLDALEASSRPEQTQLPSNAMSFVVPAGTVAEVAFTR